MSIARPPLKPLADDLWVVDRPQSFYGLEVGTRMTVVRLPGDRLWLHSPVELDGELRAALDSLGEVAFAVAPNRLHHLYAGGVTEAYPGARLWGAPGLDAKRADLTFAGILGDESPSEWAGEIEQVFSRGRPFENEVVFLHRPSRTLVATDFAFNIGPNDAAFTRTLMKLMGSYGRLGPTAIDRFFVRDAAAARQSVERVLEWDFERVIVSHGGVVETGGKEQLRKGYAFLLSAKK